MWDLILVTAEIKEKNNNPSSIAKISFFFHLLSLENYSNSENLKFLLNVIKF